MNKPVSLTNQLKAAQRELAKRERMYPRWVREGKLKAPVADHEIRSMEAIVLTLEKLIALDETTQAMKKQYCIRSGTEVASEHGSDTPPD